MPLTPRRLFFTLVGIAAIGAVGLVLLEGAYEGWLRGQVLLTRSRLVPRLVTYGEHPVEFALRCAFLGLLALTFITLAVAWAVGLIHRLQVLRSNFFTGEFQSRWASRLMLTSLACFLAWFALLGFLPFAYD